MSRIDFRVFQVLSAQELHDVITANYDSATALTVPGNSKRTELSLLGKLRIVAAYLEVAKSLPRDPQECDESALTTAMKKVFIEQGYWKQYAAITVSGTKVVLDRSRTERLKRKITQLMCNQDDLDEVMFLCSTPTGRNRVRLTGGGRKKLIPDRLAYLVYARLHTLTLLHGKFTNDDIIHAVKDYSHGFPDLIVIEKGGDIPAGTIVGNRKILFLTSLVLHRFRQRFQVKMIRGVGTTSVDVMKAMMSGFESEVRCRAAVILGFKR